MMSAKEKERELIVSLGEKGKSVRDIADILDVSKSKAAFWINRYKKTKCLKDKPRSGKPTPLTEKKLNLIGEAIKSGILEFDKKTGTSSKEVLQLIEHKTKKKYSLRHVQRLLHRMGFALITPRVSHVRKDKEAQEKFRKEFKKKSRKNIWTISS